jgi:hypothetical protein
MTAALRRERDYRSGRDPPVDAAVFIAVTAVAAILAIGFVIAICRGVRSKGD